MYDSKHRLVNELALPSEMKEGWGITHDYVKDEQNIWRLHHAHDKNEEITDDLFERGILLTPSALLFDGWIKCDLRGIL